MEVGAESAVSLSQLSAVRAEGTQVRLFGADGAELLRLFCETKDQAKVWQCGLEEVAQLHGLKSSPTSARTNGTAGGVSSARGEVGAASRADVVSNLREQCQWQEERVNALEASNRMREEQLVKLHSKLEEALVVLQAGQATYSEQQVMLEAQEARIQTLQEAAQAKAVASSTLGAGAADDSGRRPASRSGARPEGADAAEAEADSGTETGADAPLDADTDADTEAEDAATEMAALARRAEELQRQLEELSVAAASGTARTSPSAASATAGAREAIESQVAAASQAMAAAPQLLAHLHNLIAEKDRLESQLRGEQDDLQHQLNHLYSQMGPGPTLEEVDEDDGEDTSP